MAIGVLNIDFAAGPNAITGLGQWSAALVLVRYRGVPVGTIMLDAEGDWLRAEEVWREASLQLGEPLCAALAADLAGTAEAEPPASPGSASVVICTRDRPEDLRRCLESLAGLTSVEVVVVDNAPRDDRSRVVAESFDVRYTVERRRGLNWARWHGAKKARGDILVYIDDDVVVERGWDQAIVRPFRDPEVAAVAGLILPVELQSSAQELFERHVSFQRGYQRREFTINNISPLAAGDIGAGASLAIRRHLVIEEELFQAEIDAGTATLSGGDTYALYRLLSSGHRVVYEPAAVAWHRHRATDEELRRTLYGYSVGVYCFFLRCLLSHAELGALPAALRWLRKNLAQLLPALARHPNSKPVRLLLAELRGAFTAPFAYLRAELRERRLSRRERSARAAPRVT